MILFADSTFCFLNINGKPTGFRIQHDDRYSGIILKSDSLSRTIITKVFMIKKIGYVDSLNGISN